MLFTKPIIKGLVNNKQANYKELWANYDFVSILAE